MARQQKMRKMMDEKAKSLKDILYECVQKGKWEEVMKIYEVDIEASSLVLTKARETALHLAVYENKEEVVEGLVQSICKFQQIDDLKIKNERNNTALHVAAVMGSAKMCHIIGSVDLKLVDERNIDGETPLFLAAVYGHRWAFFCLYEFCKRDRNRFWVNSRRNDGDTFLHIVLKNEKFDFAFEILNMSKESASWVDEKGFTPLHILATKPRAFESGGNLVGPLQHIVYYCFYVEELRYSKPRPDKYYKGKATKHTKAASFPANYATCISFFTYLLEGIFMIFFVKRDAKKNHQEPSNIDEELGEMNENHHESNPQSEPQAFFKRDRKNENEDPSNVDKNVGQGSEIKETHDEASHESDTQAFLKQPALNRSIRPWSATFPKNYDTFRFLIQLIFSAILIVLGLGSAKYRKIKEMKKKHCWSVQVMEKLLELAPPNYGENGDTPSFTENAKESTPYMVGEGGEIAFDQDLRDQIFSDSKPSNKELGTVTAKESPILIAAKNGVVEMVSRICDHFPIAIYDCSRDKKNAVLLAAEFRRPEVYKFLLNKKTKIETLFRAVDKQGNSALHLAAHSRTHKAWRITGAALQMQWEVKWYRYVKDSVGPHFFIEYNAKAELAKTIFNNTHKELEKEGEEWFTNTSKSCSVLATIILTVAYASATTIPGGNEPKTGLSPFMKETGMFLFSVASLIAVFLSTTSVIMFLAILTSRFDEIDWGTRLPRRLFIGLSSLFFSIVAMLVSFCAGHYFLLSSRLHSVEIFIYVGCSLLVASFFVLPQLPLYFDLLYAILIKLPKRSTELIPMEKDLIL